MIVDRRQHLEENFENSTEAVTVAIAVAAEHLSDVELENSSRHSEEEDDDVLRGSTEDIRHLEE